MYIYPENLKAKPMLWLWLLRDIAIIGVAALISVLSLVQGVGMAPLVVTVLYAFLSYNNNYGLRRGSQPRLFPSQSRSC